ncbi:TetR family transcriptional regulator [Cellulomonas sp. SLBN-39]|nr:TetR family transcriptional regulator [Cellulomonas sp. SLBN-39]
MDLPAADGLRARKKRERRELLIDVTHRLVAEHGLDGVTVEAVCAQAGVSTRTFFNYFETKDDAALGFAPFAVDGPAAEAFAAGGPTRHLLADAEVLVRSWLDVPAAERARFERGLELARREPRLLVRQMALMERHKGEVGALVARRLGTDPAHPADVVAGLLVMLLHVSVMRSDTTGGDPAQHVADVADALRAVLRDGPGPG